MKSTRKVAPRTAPSSHNRTSCCRIYIRGVVAPVYTLQISCIIILAYINNVQNSVYSSLHYSHEVQDAVFDKGASARSRREVYILRSLKNKESFSCQVCQVGVCTGQTS